jgi:hypothetical protein
VDLRDDGFDAVDGVGFLWDIPDKIGLNLDEIDAEQGQ